MSSLPPDPAEPLPGPELLAAWLEQHQDLLALTDPTGRLLWTNARFRAVCGFGHSAGDAVPIARLAPAGARGDAARACVAACLSGSDTADTLLDMSADAGAPLWLRVSARHNGTQVLWTLRDETREHTLAAQARRLDELLDMAQDFGRLGVWERDIESGKGSWDRHVFGFWGLDPSAGTPDFERARERIHPEDRSVTTYLQSTAQAGRYSQRYRVLHPDGAQRWIHSQWEIKNGPDGRPARAIGIMVDDSDVYELARSLGDASAQLKLAVDLGNIAIWRHDLQTQRMHYNDRAFAVLDIPPRPDGMAIDEVRALIHPDDLPGVLASAEQALASEHPTDMAARYRRADGSWRDVLTRRVVQRAADGTPLAFLGVALDVTEQVRDQRHAADLARRLEIAAAAAEVGIWTRDTLTEAGEWNLQMFAIHGRDPARGVPSRQVWLEEIIHPDDLPMMRTARPSLELMSEGTVEHEHRIVRPDGEVRWLVNRARIEAWNGRPMIFGVTLDITERRRTELALRSADERAALAARGAGIGTWEVDLVGGAERWDAQMFVLRGLEPADHPPAREHRLNLLHPDDRGHNVDASTDSIGSPAPSSYEFRVRLPDGSCRWLASRSVAVRGAHGQPVRRVGVNWDITEARTAEDSRQQKALAERESRAKTQFLARMSHELRTPLNAVLGFTQLLQMDADAQADRAAGAKLAHIRSAGEHLLSLINDVLELSNLQSGQVKLALQPVPLAALVAQALPLVAPLAQQHGVRVHAQALAGVAATDPTRALQVLINLLSNAIKYNRRGGEVQVETLDEGDSVRLRVSDNGRGMSEEQLAHLFEPFNRLGIEREGIEGTGIGLTIVQALVSGLGGRIDVSSRPGQGSRFEVSLPAQPASTAVPPDVATAPPPVAPPSPSRSGQLLYIEDNGVNVTLVEELVGSLTGLGITSELTGSAGVARARELRPDLILVDMQLPDFDGIEVLRRLRAHETTAAIPCIALSANAMPEDIATALSAGFADYWTKPINFKTFIAALQARFPAS